ncbi:MAG: thymidylate synthase [Ktedonobacterales bacterium]
MRHSTELPQTVTAVSLGAAWLGVARRILDDGVPTTYDTLPIVELAYVVLDIAAPDADDPIIAERGDPERLAWMRANFTDTARVAALGNADSYATRLYDYGRAGRDQIAWVIERLRRDPRARSATITTFQPLTDTSYIPCVSMLDFWIPDGALELVVYAHSIDFGTKGYANLVELAAIQGHAASALDAPVGRLIMLVKSAHIYQTELADMASLLASLTSLTFQRNR